MRSRQGDRGAAFTVVELLISLAATAILLAAVAVAFNASVINYRQNEGIFQSLNNGRQALYRITTQLRTAQAVDPNAPSNECTLITASGENITYRYVAAEGKLYLVTNDDLSDSDYVLCDQVAGMTFTKQTFVEDSQIKVKAVQISMVVGSGSCQRKLAAAAVVRRNLD